MNYSAIVSIYHRNLILNFPVLHCHMYIPSFHQYTVLCYVRTFFPHCFSKHWRWMYSK